MIAKDINKLTTRARMSLIDFDAQMLANSNQNSLVADTKVT
jgi:hypothetical protein